MIPQPIDRAAHRKSVCCCNASRPRRFACDRWKAAYYASHRAERFRARFGR